MRNLIMQDSSQLRVTVSFVIGIFSARFSFNPILMGEKYYKLNSLRRSLEIIQEIGVPGDTANVTLVTVGSIAMTPQ